MSKFIFVTGGVVSSLGKGISGASIGKLLQLRGLKVNMIKCDPYINIDPGTLSPYQHGEVFVTADGAEADLDLGTYERFLDVPMTKKNTNTTGTIYQAVIDRERRGDYNGVTVQVVPHITNEIKSRFIPFEKDFDVTIIEIGGTVGDIEGLPFLEATRQFKTERGRENVLNVHATLIPYIASAAELKTKPTQHSVNKLREIGIDPDILICRTEKPMPKGMKEKLSLFCSVAPEAVIEAMDVASIYQLPEAFEKQGITDLIIKRLHLKPRKKNDGKWFKFINKATAAGRRRITIGIAGKYAELKDAYKSVDESLNLAGMSNNVEVKVKYINTQKDEIPAALKGLDAVIVPGGFGKRGIAGKIETIKYAREKGLPFLGICLGMQCAVIEAARNQAGLKNADSCEFAPDTKDPVINMMEEQKKVKNLGGTMRLGNYEAKLKTGSIAQKLYKKSAIQERHRHRYEFNTDYVPALEKLGLEVTGWHKNLLPEIVERKDHPYFIAAQFHPEFASRPMKPHPLFDGLVKAAFKNKTQNSGE
ncbi:MAG: CTP synthase [Elusimicrobiota bacterium]|jgi:CTP synthase|nr:CTP synthase [Elusimicrobiota bacterium]